MCKGLPHQRNTETEGDGREAEPQLSSQADSLGRITDRTARTAQVISLPDTQGWLNSVH